MSDARSKLVALMRQVHTREIMVAEFAEAYEPIWNFELSNEDVSAFDADVLERVFDVAAWYSPYPEDRAAYPGYKSEADVLSTVELALAEIG